jgi:hypothetical protein
MVRTIKKPAQGRLFYFFNCYFITSCPHPWLVQQERLAQQQPARRRVQRERRVQRRQEQPVQQREQLVQGRYQQVYRHTR